MRRAGERVGNRYRIVQAIGRGGMGDVYRAVDEVLHREIALKLVKPIPDTLLAGERFRREAQAIAKIRSPYVVEAYDFGADGDGHYLAMELVEGCTVGEALREYGPFDPDRALQVIEQAAAGLAAAHELGVVHRDIKPGNLLLAPDETVKLADFGIARFLDETTTTMTSSAQIVGTSYFLAPERALGKAAAPPSDIYALGCVLYQLLTGHPPFTGDEPAAVMFQHVEQEPVLPTGLSPSLTALLRSMLAKDPAVRPTAAEIAAGVYPTAQLPPVRRSRRRFAVAAACALLAASVGTALALDRGTNELPTTDKLPTATPSTTPKPTPSVKPVAVRTTTTPTRTTVRKTAATQPSHKAGKPDKPTKPTKPKGPAKPKPKKEKGKGKP